MKQTRLPWVLTLKLKLCSYGQQTRLFESISSDARGPISVLLRILLSSLLALLSSTTVSARITDLSYSPAQVTNSIVSLEPCTTNLQEQWSISEVRRLINEAAVLREQGTAQTRMQDIEDHLNQCPQIRKTLHDELAFLDIIKRDNEKSRKQNQSSFEKFVSRLDSSKKNASENCQASDLSKQFSAPNTKAPYDWSFAFSASDLASIKLNKPISALDIVNSTATTPGGPGMFSGIFSGYWAQQLASSASGSNPILASTELSEFKSAHTSLALESAQKVGFCSQEFLGDRGANDQTLLSSIKDIENSRRKVADGLVYRCNSAWLQIFKGTGLLGLGAAVSGTSADDVIQSLINKSCLERIHPKPENFEVLTRNKQEPSDARKNIQQLMDSKTPATLTLSGDLFGEGKDRLASVTLVGRKYNAQTAQCEYSLKADFSEACAKTKAPESPGYRCQNGYVTINEDRLLYHLKEITWIK